MNDLTAAFHLALSLILGGDRALLGIVLLSLQVSLTAVAAGALIGLPMGAAVALVPFRGRQTAVLLLNSAMGLPPVVVGLLLYLVLSRSGPLGAFGLLFTPTAMAIAQTILVLPIIAALTRQIIETLWEEYAEQLCSMGCSRLRAVPTLLWDARYSLATVVLAGFGRAIAEVGAVIIVGGNIGGYTRTMTTAIVLETSRGDLPMALAFGTVLILLATGINAASLFIAHLTREGIG